MDIHDPIKTEEEYHLAALARIDALMEAEAGTPEGQELDLLTKLVLRYEEDNIPL